MTSPAGQRTRTALKRVGRTLRSGLSWAADQVNRLVTDRTPKGQSSMLIRASGPDGKTSVVSSGHPGGGGG